MVRAISYDVSSFSCTSLTAAEYALHATPTPGRERRSTWRAFSFLASTAVATLLFLGVCSADASILGSHSAQYAAEQFTDATQGGGGFYGVAVPEPAAAVSTVVETAAPSAPEF